MRPKLFLLFFFLTLSVACSAHSQIRKRQLDSVVNVIRKVNDYWQQHHSPETSSFWNWAAYHTGNMEAVKLMGELKAYAKHPDWAKEREAWRNYSISWAEHNNWMGATESNPALWRYRDYGEDQQHVLFGDWQICFQTYIDLYHTLEDERCIARAKEVMDYEVDSKEADYWWWADALYMVMPVMTKMYRLTGSEKYLDKLYANICYSDSIMLDTATGLYYRDARYVYPRHKTLDGRKDFWARGNGWVLAGLAKVLQDVPRNYQHHSFFAEKFRRLAKAVAAQQQPEGYWSRSLMDAAQAPGPETSGTAFFVYGLLWGINNGYLSAADFMPTVKKAWSYLMYTALQPDGSIGYVQPIGDRAIPGQTIGRQSQADFGVGAFLLAACEYARWVSRK